MEKVPEGLEGAASLEAELTCSICLCLYKDPVSLSCGHSFCKQCIQRVLRAQQQSQAPYICPVCRLDVGPILELQKNIQLCNIVEAFQATTPKEKEGEGSEEGETEALPCDYCLDEPQPAVKSCLICDVSLCQAHLNKHDAKASHQDHVLVEGRADSAAEDRRCLKHNRLLECYCQDEGRYICVFCTIWGGHKGHKIITLKKGHVKQLSNLSNVLAQQQERKSALVTALEELQKNENQLKINTKAVTSEIKSLFDEIKMQISKRENEVLSNIQSNEKKLLERVTKVKEKIEQRREETEQNIQSLQKMRQQQDIFLFFKEFKKATDRIASQNSDTDIVNMVVTPVNVTSADYYQEQIDSSMLALDIILKIMQDELTNQITWSREHDPVPNTDGVKLANPPVTLVDSTTDNTLCLLKELISETESSFEAAPGRGSTNSSSFWGGGDGGGAATAQPGGVSYGTQTNVGFQSGTYSCFSHK